MEGIALTALRTIPSLALVTIGFFVALRILRFPDLTCDASFSAGMVGFAVGMHLCGSSLLGLVISLIMGATAGFLTGGMYSMHPTGVFKLLASVLVMYGFYSINFRCMRQHVDEGFFGEDYFFSYLSELEKFAHPWRPISYIVAITIVLLTVFALIKFFKTQLGVRIRVAGWYPNLLTDCGRSYTSYTILGLIIANATIAIGGWLYTSLSASVDIVARGVVIEAIASLLLGELIIDMFGFLRDRRTHLPVAFLAPIAGTVVYVIIRSFATYILKDQFRVFIQSDRYVIIAGIIFLTVLLARSQSIHYTDSAYEEAL